MTPLPLTGKIPGLLRECSPVILDPSIRDHYGGKSTGVVFAVGTVTALVTFLEDCRPLPIPLEELTLDMLNPTGRFHVRLYLQEQGYDVGNEDRPDILSLSVQSVWQGGVPVVGMVGAWGPYGHYPGGNRCHRDPVVGEGYACVTTGEFAEWWAGTNSRYLRGPETEDTGKSACDAALLRLGYAVTNPDGTITFPPLPEGAL